MLFPAAPRTRHNGPHKLFQTVTAKATLFDNRNLQGLGLRIRNLVLYPTELRAPRLGLLRPKSIADMPAAMKDRPPVIVWAGHVRFRLFGVRLGTESGHS